MGRIFVGVGSNEGDRLATISRGVQALGAIAGVRIIQMALVAETTPVGGPPQGPYLNTVVEVDTTIPPRELLQSLKAIERQLGRKPSNVRWAPRPIDLDLLLYGDVIIREPDLEVPHPRMHERRFVLEPLAQLAPDVMHPVLKQSVASLLARLPAAPSPSSGPGSAQAGLLAANPA